MDELNLHWVRNALYISGGLFVLSRRTFKMGLAAADCLIGNALAAQQVAFDFVASAVGPLSAARQAGSIKTA